MLWIAIDPGSKRRLGTIDPLEFIMVCIPQDSEHGCNPAPIPSPCSAKTLDGSMAIPKGIPTPEGCFGCLAPELAVGWWVLHPKLAQLSCPQPPRQQEGCPCPSAPHPKRKHPKTPNPGGAVPLWVPGRAVPVRRSVVVKAEVAPPPLSPT